MDRQRIRKIRRRDRAARNARVFLDIETTVDDCDESEQDGSGLTTDDSIEGAIDFSVGYLFDSKLVCRLHCKRPR